MISLQARWPMDTSSTRASDQELDMRRTLSSGKASGMSTRSLVASVVKHVEADIGSHLTGEEVSNAQVPEGRRERCHARIRVPH